MTCVRVGADIRVWLKSRARAAVRAPHAEAIMSWSRRSILAAGGAWAAASVAVQWAPDMDDPAVQKAHFRLVDELGKRYDGHPDFDLLDVGTVGLWGEWHMSVTKVSLPTTETRRAVIERWCRAFPKSPKVMLIG